MIGNEGKRAVVAPPDPPKSLKFLYGTKFGGLVLRLITARWVSRLAGFYLDRRISKIHIKKYIKRHGIDVEEYLPEKYRSFNAFFTRKIKPELRPFDSSAEAFVSPCDAKLTVYPAGEGTFHVKGFDYSVDTLLKDSELANRFMGGFCLVFRLTVSDYHRYYFCDGGEIGNNYFIKGRLHTVQPAALEKRRVFTENCREITVLNTDRFGCIAQVEVGAMMVGRIVNDKKEGRFEFGEEKGRFEFGGSTVILLVEKDRIAIDPEILENTQNGLETCVKCGEKIGTCAAFSR